MLSGMEGATHICAFAYVVAIASAASLRGNIMLSSLRTRLIVICVLIVAFAMIALSAANIYGVRRDTLETLNTEMAQLTDSHAANIAEWVRSKRTITGSMK